MSASDTATASVVSWPTAGAAGDAATESTCGAASPQELAVTTVSVKLDLPVPSETVVRMT